MVPGQVQTTIAGTDAQHGIAVPVVTLALGPAAGQDVVFEPHPLDRVALQASAGHGQNPVGGPVDGVLIIAPADDLVLIERRPIERRPRLVVEEDYLAGAHVGPLYLGLGSVRCGICQDGQHRCQEKGISLVHDAYSSMWPRVA